AKGRGYYLMPAYPVLYAGGAVWGERWLANLSHRQSKPIWAAVITALTISALGAAAVGLPLAPVPSAWFRAAGVMNITLRDEIGWDGPASRLAQRRRCP